MNTVLPFTDPAGARPEITGGKGANLSILTQRGFPVPPGFVVTAGAYKSFVESGLDVLWRVPELPFGNPAALRQASLGLQEELGRIPLPATVALAVRDALAGFPPDTAFSVRSSSTMEDLAGAAFAGQHETFLNVRGLEQVLRRIRDCYCSLWADRALAYREQRGFDHQRAAMAVVVQQMVPAEVAGVGFSIDPVSGRLGDMVFNANFGLGESVVSGDGEVDQWIVDKASGAVKTARVARKTRQVVGGAEGTEERLIAESDSERASLAPAQLAELAALLVRVEQSYRFPQDIEWAFAGGKLWLLQSRPITTLPARWTRDESAERFPSVISPLTWAFVESGFHRSLNHSFRLLGFPPFDGKWFGMFGHYIYGNQNAVELYGRRAPFQVRSVDELRAAIPRLREEFRWVQDLPVVWMRDLDDYLIHIGRLLSEPLKERSLAEIWAHVVAVNEHGAQYFLPNIAISIAHGTLYRLLHGLLKLLLGAPEADRLFDDLMAFCETKTGQINKELFELAALARRAPGLAEAMASRTSRELTGVPDGVEARTVEEGALSGWPVFAGRLAKFLRDHGHREVEFDAYVPTWLEQPWVVLDNVKLLLQSPPGTTPAERERELKIRQQRAEVDLFNRLPADLHFFVHELLRLARVYTSLDDLEHYQTTRLTLPLRRGLREFGARLVQRGILEYPMDIFFALPEQVDRALAADDAVTWTEFARCVRSQKAAYLSDKDRIPAWTLDGSGRDPDSPTGSDSLSANVLKGLAGSPGVAEGKVHLVRSSDDFADFPKGSVLVARTTNPTWTPLFYLAAAVITESGGPLSHGAVTAREMKIPAVMSVPGCLTQLKNGQRVRVEGTQGRVVLLQEQ